MRLITLYMPEPWLKALDGLVAAKLYPNRAEAIRFAVRDLIRKEQGLKIIRVGAPGQGMSYEAISTPGIFEPNTPAKTVKNPEC